MVKISVPKRGIGGTSPRLEQGQVEAARQELSRKQGELQAILSAGEAVAGVIGRFQAEREAESKKLGSEQAEVARNQLNTFAAQEQSRFRRETLQDPNNFQDEDSVAAVVQEHADSLIAFRDEQAQTIKDEELRQAFIRDTDGRIGQVVEGRFATQAFEFLDAANADRADNEIDETARLSFETNSPAFLGAARQQAENDPRLDLNERNAAKERVQSIGAAYYIEKLKGPDAFSTALTILGDPESVGADTGSNAPAVSSRALKVVMNETNPSTGSGGTASLHNAQAADVTAPGSFEEAAGNLEERLAAARTYLPETMRGRIDAAQFGINQGREELKQARELAAQLAAGNPVPINTNTRVGELAAAMDWESTFSLMQDENDLLGKANLLVNHVKLAGSTSHAVGYVLTLDPLFDQNDAVELGAISDGLRFVPAPRRAEFGRTVVNAMRRYGQNSRVMDAVRAIDPDAAIQLEERVRSGTIKGVNQNILNILAERGEIFEAVKALQGGTDRSNQLDFALSASLQAQGDKDFDRGAQLDRLQRDITHRTEAYLRDTDLAKPDFHEPNKAARNAIPEGSFKIKKKSPEVAARLAPMLAPLVAADFNSTNLDYDTAVNMSMNEDLSTLMHSNFKRGEPALDSPELYYDGAWELFKMETRVGALKDKRLDFMKVVDFEIISVDQNGIPSYQIYVDGPEGVTTVKDPDAPGSPWIFSLAGASERYEELMPGMIASKENERNLVEVGFETIDRSISEVDDHLTEYWTKRRPIAKEAGSFRTPEQETALNKQMMAGRYPLGGTIKPLMETTRAYLNPKTRPTKQSGVGMFDDPAPGPNDLPGGFEKLENDLKQVVESVDLSSLEAGGMDSLDQIESETMLRWTTALREGADRKFQRHERFLAKLVESGEMEQRFADEFLAAHSASLAEFKHDLDWAEQELNASQEYFLTYQVFDAQEPQVKVRSAKLIADYIGYRNALGLGLPSRENEDGTTRLPTNEELDKEVEEWIKRGGLIDWRGGNARQP